MTRRRETFALYIEGFHPGDGLALAKAISEVTRQEGKAVVVYKAGRTPEGRAATTSHTASVAGDYEIARAVLGGAGATVVDTIADFTGFIKGLVFLADKKVRGTRAGLISNAGFECVIMADNLKNDSDLTLASLSAGTVGKIRSILAPLGIDRLQDIRNPIDITPVGDDAVFCDCARALLEDDSVDCAVVSLVPWLRRCRPWRLRIPHPRASSIPGARRQDSSIFSGRLTSLLWSMSTEAQLMIPWSIISRGREFPLSGAATTPSAF